MVSAISFLLACGVALAAAYQLRAQQTAPGTWVEGFFFDDTKLSDKRMLNMHDLDEVSKEHPVAVQHRGGHTSYYNSKALEMAGKIATKSKATVTTGKEAFYRQIEMPLSEAYIFAANVMVENMMAHDAGEGIGAFIEKRSPKWKDR